MMVTDKSRFNEKVGAAHWLEVEDLFEAMVSFGAKIAFNCHYDEEHDQFLISFPDKSIRLATLKRGASHDQHE